jgi:hypothetical protein
LRFFFLLSNKKALPNPEHFLHAAEGLSNDVIAERLDTRREVVSL